MPQLDPDATADFVTVCRTASTSMTNTIGEAKRLYSSMMLDMAPVPTVDFVAAGTAADDYEDVATMAHICWLDATNADSEGLGEYSAYNWSPFNRVDKTLKTADNLIAGGEDGRDVRDARNAGISVEAMRLAIKADADIEVTDDGLIVAQTNGIEKDIPLIVDDVKVTIPLNARGGTTYGNVFIAPAGTIKFDENDKPIDADPAKADKRAKLLRHETRHTYQWAAAGPYEFSALYLAEEARRAIPEIDVNIDWDWPPISGSAGFPPPGCTNAFEEHAGLEDGGYNDCGD